MAETVDGRFDHAEAPKLRMKLRVGLELDQPDTRRSAAGPSHHTMPKGPTVCAHVQDHKVVSATVHTHLLDEGTDGDRIICINHR